jgi:choline dehydrogenase-like flavoprotein
MTNTGMKIMANIEFDFDWLLIGSGFGGSVSALRLSEKGYKVGVLECGRRFRDEDFAESTWHLGRFLRAPVLGLKGDPAPDALQGCVRGQRIGCQRQHRVCQ